MYGVPVWLVKYVRTIGHFFFIKQCTNWCYDECRAASHFKPSYHTGPHFTMCQSKVVMKNPKGLMEIYPNSRLHHVLTTWLCYFTNTSVYTSQDTYCTHTIHTAYASILPYILVLSYTTSQIGKDKQVKVPTWHVVIAWLDVWKPEDPLEFQQHVPELTKGRLKGMFVIYGRFPQGGCKISTWGQGKMMPTIKQHPVGLTQSLTLWLSSA